ncbi:MAG: hypothetical protein ACP6IP_04955 [Candidatus Njordarchaeia archaeon]
MSKEGWIKAQCPKCGTIELFHLTEEQEKKLKEQGGILSLAFDHGDHVLVVAVDATRDVRGEYVYDKAEKKMDVPISHIIDTSKPSDQVEFLMKKARKWMAFLFKGRNDKKMKIIGNVSDEELRYIVDTVKAVRSNKVGGKHSELTIESENKDETILIRYTKDGDLLASIVRSGRREDVEKAREILSDLIGNKNNKKK